MDIVVIALAILCVIFGLISAMLGSLLLIRVIKFKRIDNHASTQIKSMENIFFTKDDVLWLWDTRNRANSQATVNDVRPNSRRNTISVKLLEKKIEGRKYAAKLAATAEMSQCTMMSSTLSLDPRCATQNVALLVKSKKRAYFTFQSNTNMDMEANHQKSSYLKELRGMAHENVNAFWGMYSDPYKQGFLFNFAYRGSLQDVVLRRLEDKIPLDWAFKESLIRDLVDGMKYIHKNSPLDAHGNLRSTKCLLDHRWVLKITGFGLESLMGRESIEEHSETWLWTAPEHIKDPDTAVTPKGDVYSFGIILQELITETKPFGTMDLESRGSRVNGDMRTILAEISGFNHVLEIVRKLCHPPPLCRPSVSKSLAPPDYINLMKECWSEKPELRPTFTDIAKLLTGLNNGKKPNLIDSILKKLEKHSLHLEEIVKDRTMELEGEKKKTEQLLCRMLPKSIADTLKAGCCVPPENYDQVTIFFSDIVGFTSISAASSPIQIVNLLNTVYTKFDEVIGHYDVYKVETIGDAYMCVSGLPERNGIYHAGEIATMALDLLSTITSMKVPHLNKVPLKLRIGCHSGHCAAGVVGLTMPRYCLFGDTVNTASRMESNSRADRIHISRDTKLLLDMLGNYSVKDRGYRPIKGKGRMYTYWLVGKDGFDKPLPQFTDDCDEENDAHGLETLLTAEELQQLNEATFMNASPKNSHVDLRQCSTPDSYNASPLLPVPNRLMLNTRASKTQSNDSLNDSKTADLSHNNVHRVEVLSVNADFVDAELGSGRVSDICSSSAGAPKHHTLLSRHQMMCPDDFI